MRVGDLMLFFGIIILAASAFVLTRRFPQDAPTHMACAGGDQVIRESKHRFKQSGSLIVGEDANGMIVYVFGVPPGWVCRFSP